MSIFKNIFSVKNIEEYKVLTILGLRFKIKNKLLCLKKEFYQAIADKNKEFEYKVCKYMPEEKYSEYLKEWFFLRTGQSLNLDNPVTYNEKIQWMKLYDSTPLKTRLADKYLVRDLVKEKIGEEYLIPLLGAWEKFDDIDFDKLPDKFVLKANHGCGWNIIVKDKSKLDKEDAKKNFDKWMHTNWAYCAGLELHYKDIKPLIIAEEYLENSTDELTDYKVWCFNGKAHFVQHLCERKTGLKMAFYDRDWNRLDFVYSYEYNQNNIPRPEKLDKLLELSEKLAQNFAHARVDFYILNDGTIKFGEITFTSCSGCCKWNIEDTDKRLGDLIDLNYCKQKAEVSEN